MIEVIRENYVSIIIIVIGHEEPTLSRKKTRQYHHLAIVYN